MTYNNWEKSRNAKTKTTCGEVLTCDDKSFSSPSRFRFRNFDQDCWSAEVLYSTATFSASDQRDRPQPMTDEYWMLTKAVYVIWESVRNATNFYDQLELGGICISQLACVTYLTFSNHTQHIEVPSYKPHEFELIRTWLRRVYVRMLAPLWNLATVSRGNLQVAQHYRSKVLSLATRNAKLSKLRRMLWILAVLIRKTHHQILFLKAPVLYASSWQDHRCIRQCMATNRASSGRQNGTLDGPGWNLIIILQCMINCFCCLAWRWQLIDAQVGRRYKYPLDWPWFPLSWSPPSTLQQYASLLNIFPVH